MTLRRTDSETCELRSDVASAMRRIVDETYIHDGDGLLAGVTEIFDHILDQHGALGDETAWNGVSVLQGMRGGERGRRILVVTVTPSELTRLICWSSVEAMILCVMCGCLN